MEIFDLLAVLNGFQKFAVGTFSQFTDTDLGENLFLTVLIFILMSKRRKSKRGHPSDPTDFTGDCKGI
jgi:hypothetical protein